VPPRATRTQAATPAAPAAGKRAARPPATRAAAPPRLAGKPAVRLPVAGSARKKSGAGAAPAAEPASTVAKEPPDPRLTQALVKVRRNAARLKKHDPAKSKADQAQEAAEPPEKEVASRAQANKVGEIKSEMESAEKNPPSVDERPPQEKSFLEMLEEEIDRVMPKTVEDTDSFMGEEEKQNLKGSMSGNIEAQKQKVTGPVKAAAGAKPDESVVAPKTVVTPLPAPLPKAAAESVGAREAMPAPLPDERVSLQSSKDDAQRQFDENKITPTQLQKANDPRFSAVLKAKQDVDAHADAAPQRYRQFEQKTLSTAVGRAVASERRDTAAMLGAHGRKGGDVAGHQGKAMKDDRDRRQEVVDFIEKKFAATKEAVEKKLATLEADVSKKFDEGIEKNIKSMKDEATRKKDDWKDDRYYWHGVMTRPDLWLYDKARGIDRQPKVKRIYVEAAEQFTRDMKSLVREIARFVEGRLREAKDEVERGRKEIHDFVGKLDGKLGKVGLEAEKAVSERFDELTQSIEDKKRDLASSLAGRYKEAHDKAGEAIKEMQAEDKGFVSAFLDKLREIIEILSNFRRRVMSLLRKAASAIDLIVSDPIGFLENLLSAVKRGINQFVDRIWEHLKTGFMEWLFGSLAALGVAIPKDLSVPSILQLVLDVLGITADRIRAKVAKIIGERNMAMLTAAWEAVGTFLKGGPAALWEQIKEYVSNLKEMVVDAIQEWLVSTVVKSAVAKIVMMFNPVGAIIQAIMMIYRTVMFFVENINRILDFVEAIIDSVYNIATGAIGSAADWIEKALARTIPIIISFLARLLGLTGLSEKIRGFILRVQTRIDKAIDKVIEKIVGGVKKLIGAGKAVAGKVFDWFKVRVGFKTDDGRPHTLFFEGSEKAPHLMIATTPVAVEVFLDRKEAEANSATSTLTPTEKTVTLRVVGEARGVVNEIKGFTYPPAGAEPRTAEANQVSERVKHLSLLIKSLKTDSGAVPPAVVTPGFSSRKATGLSVRYLFNHATNHRPGTPASAYGGDLDGALTTLEILGVRGKWVAFHILNEHAGGPAVDSNLVPTTIGVNNDYKTDFEQPHLLSNLRANRVVWMNFSLTPRSDSPKFVDKITATGGTMEYEGNRWSEGKKSNMKFPTFSAKVPPPESRTIFINRIPRAFPDRPAIVRFTPMTAALLDLLVDNRGSRPYEDKRHMKGVVRGYVYGLRRADPERTLRGFFTQIDEADIEFGP
jgi:hypothetical protein